MNAALLSSVKMDYETPDGLLDRVRLVFAGEIGLDPATNDNNPTRALRFFTPEVNGLAWSWVQRGPVFVNPPYGGALKQWAVKIASQAAMGCEIVALVPARTDTEWFRRMQFEAKAICFLRGRVKFRGMKAGAPFPCAVFYFGPRVDMFRGIFGDLGWFA